MAIISLDRRFWEWSKGDPVDPDVLARLYRPTDLLSWDDVSARRRVVLLAEAGSGKTEEMREQARLRVAAAQHAFFATVEDVAEDGLDGALRAAERPRLAAWRTSDQDAWFFIDSIDEAKLGRVRLDRAFRKIADGISRAERRAHVILSCRLLDWEFASDLERLKSELPIPPDPNLPPPPSGDEVLVHALRHEMPEKEKLTAEQPLVVLMVALDEPRLRRFASEKGVLDVAAFLDQIQSANLWRFARRPLDLDWLVQFWKDHGRLGSLAEMLKSSLAARVAETKTDRARDDTLDATRALHAIERIGAALVFGRKATISVPDSELLRPEDERPLNVDEVLPDWSAQDRSHLLSRPIFDPATFGRARLHNDNEGTVRGYLTACWLRRLRENKLSRGELFGLIFATSYGIELIKPSVQETAAWLALWDEDVGREVARREPALLLTAGDPASLSPAVRAAVLTDIIERLAAGARLLILDFDSVKRFSRPDLSPVIAALWPKYEGCTEARELMLRIIWLGPLADCAQLAEQALRTYAERYTRIIAGRAICAAGDAAMKMRYASFVSASCATLPNTITIEAIDALFPTVIGVADLLALLACIDVTDADGGLSIEWQLPGWIDRVTDRAALEALLRGMLDGLGPEARDIGQLPNKRDETYLIGLASAAYRLLAEFCADGEAPTDAIDAAMRIGIAFRYGRHSIREIKDVGAELRRTAARRRLALWRVAEQRNGHPWLHGQPAQNLMQIEFFGFPLCLQLEDAAWLLDDASVRTAENERRLAINASMTLWRGAGEPTDLLARIERVAQPDRVLLGDYRAWITPRTMSAEEAAQEQHWKEISERNSADRAAREASWLEFAERLRKDPDELRHLRPPTAEGVDARLFHLWQLLSADIDSRYSIDSVAPLEPMFGAEVAALIKDALIAHWRLWRPRLKSQRKGAQLNQVSMIDIMGVTGISLEAGANPKWADALSADEAILAAEYATLEINGYPTWLLGLAQAKPAQVREVLLREVAAELDDPEPKPRYDNLEDIARTDAPIAGLMAPTFLSELKQRINIPNQALSPFLVATVKGIGAERAELCTLLLARFTEVEDGERRGLFLSAAFAIDAVAATEALTHRLDELDERAQTELVQQILPSIFGTSFHGPEFESPTLDFTTLERLVTIAFHTLRVDEDHARPSGQVFSPDQRDHAEHARGKAFEQLANTPGWASFEAILRLTENAECPIPRSRLLEIARNRAAEDAEGAAWAPGDALTVETNAEAPPRTAKDLQSVALRRLDDMQHDLLHGDFSQGATLKAQQNETAVQNWIADRLRLKQGQAYSVEREPHVAGEKEPDVRLRAKATDASVAIEIKVAESWSIPQLEAALSEQLCTRYLRARDARHGILLLVHQDARPQGWRDPQTGRFLTFLEVTAHLRQLAVGIASAASDAPQPEIAILDVSSCEAKGAKR